MQITELKLAGFKSFVDPTTIRIDPGLTGIVGPNGCGKSNLLEALRWVMGANSAKAMRAEDMDDVIFAGASGRPPREHAEVAITLDNTERRAPAQFNDLADIAISRKIRRGAGSTYKINGKEARARDVQLLFADASTGANSPALVRQGQISELISAKPENRRRILEEASGIAGLQGRRHEAELKLKAAEDNLARLDDHISQIEETRAGLLKQSRQAERYRKISQDIRGLEALIAFRAWAEAIEAAQVAITELSDAQIEAAAAESAAAQARIAATEAEAALSPLREEEMVAAAILRRLEGVRVGLDRDAREARAAIARLDTELTRARDDIAREDNAVRDADLALAKLADEAALLEPATETRDSPRLTAARAASEAGQATLAARQQALEAVQAALSKAQMAHRLAAAQVEDAAQKRARAEAHAKAAAAAIAAAPNLAGLQAGVDQARAALAAAEADYQQAADAADAAEGEMQTLRQAEQTARDAASAADAARQRLAAEAQGLEAALSRGASAKAARPVLAHIHVAPRYEAALAAALGDDLDAPLLAEAPQAASAWGGAAGAVHAPALSGAIRLAEKVTAPPALAARLEMTFVAARAEFAELAPLLPAGARLVSPQGDLLRWDGFQMRAGAPAPAAIRLQQMAKLTALKEDLASAAAKADALKAARAEAQNRLAAAEQEARARKGAVALKLKTLPALRQTIEEMSRARAAGESRALAAAAQQDSAARALTEAEAQLRTAQDALAQAPAPDPQPAALADAQQALIAARGAAEEARAALLTLERAIDAEAKRRLRLQEDQAAWTTRRARAAARLEALQTEAAAAQQALRAAKDDLPTHDKRLADLGEETILAERRRKTGADALAAAEAKARAANDAARSADRAAGSARERLARAETRGETERARLAETLEAVGPLGAANPSELEARAREALGAQADLPPAEARARLDRLRRERDGLGAVNLRADEEASILAEKRATLDADRADLTAAIAKLRRAIGELNSEARERLGAAFTIVNGHFQALFATLFDGGQAELRLVGEDDPLSCGLEIFACPPGKRLSTLSLMSGGEQALTASALIFAVFLSNPAPVCVLDEVDAPLDDANVARYCLLLEEMKRLTGTRFLAITHNPVTMSRMDRLYGVTMRERGVSTLVSVQLAEAEALVATA